MRHLIDRIRAIDTLYVGERGYDAEGAAAARTQAVLRERRILVGVPSELPYDEFLDCPYWQHLSRWLKEFRAGMKCERCGSRFKGFKPVELHVHHKTYAHRGNEYPDHLDDLQVLCSDCHAREHGQVRL